MVKIVGRSLLQGQMGQIFVIGIVGNESDVFVTAQWWCGGVVVWWCGGVVVGGENIDIVGSITKCAHQERRTQERTAATILGTPPGTFDIKQLPNPTNLPDTFPNCIGDRCFARTSTTGNGNNKNWFIKETLGWRAWFAISTFNKRSHWAVRDVLVDWWMTR
jgi:hypothetical protein